MNIFQESAKIFTPTHKKRSIKLKFATTINQLAQHSHTDHWTDSHLSHECKKPATRFITSLSTAKPKTMNINIIRPHTYSQLDKSNLHITVNTD